MCIGGLGVRGTCDVALPPFLASLHPARDLVHVILSDFNMAESGDRAAAEESFVGRWPGLAAPTDVCSQMAWDMPCALAVRDKMLFETDQVGRARLLAACCRESGVWLGAVPVSSLGTQLDSEVLRIGITLRLGLQFVKDIGVDVAPILTRRDTNHCPVDTVLVASPIMRN